MEILREHYCGRSKPRIVALYTELTSLKKSTDASVTDYFLHAEKIATALKNAGETISDGLLVAMCLKGLPAEYSTFSTVITQREDDVTFTEFKAALKSFEETAKPVEAEAAAEKVMKTDVNQIVCFQCKKPGHKKYQCNEYKKLQGNTETPGSNKPSKWCRNCKRGNHNTNECRRNRSNYAAKNVNVDDNSYGFAMKISDYDNINLTDATKNKLLVDCGETSHIITDKNKFVSFDSTFDPSSHYVELADGSRSNNVVYGKGNASVVINDIDGCAHKVLLKDSLCIPSYKQDILSVRSAVDQGVTVNFSPDGNELIAGNDTKFGMNKCNNLYFLNNVSDVQNKCRSLQKWHEVLGHCNIKDVLSLEKVVQGMTITDKEKFCL